MPEYLSPGVYVEEIDAGPKPIEGVSTSTSGAVGVTMRGPSRGKPELVTSFADFVRRFGGYVPEPDPGLVNQWALNTSEGGRWWQLALSVRGFFDNGGQRLYVKRVFSSGAAASNGQTGVGVVSELADDADSGDTRLRLRHLLGIQVGTNLNLFTGGSAVAGNPFTVTAYDPGLNQVTLNNPIPVDMREERDFAEIVPRVVPAAGPPDTRTLRFSAASVGAWGDGLRVRVRPMVGATLKILHDPASGGAPFQSAMTADAAAGATNIDVADASGFLVGDVALIRGRRFAISGIAANTLTIAPASPGPWTTGTLVQRLRTSNVIAPGNNTLNVQGAAQLYPDAVVELDNGSLKEMLVVVSVAGPTVTFNNDVANAYHETDKLRVLEAEVQAQYEEDGVIEAEEVFTNLRLHDDGSNSFLATNINSRSTLIQVTVGSGYSDSDFTAFPSVPPPAAPADPALWMSLTGGDDNLAGLTVDDFVGVDGGSENRTGIQALEDIDEISICTVPGIWSATVQSALIQHCEILKDRFAILDPRDGLSIEGIREFRETLDSKYAALYYPWIEVRDPSVRRNVMVGPSGHMAGLYARVDVERGVHKAPANEIIRGITRISQDVTKREQDMLNPKGINALRFFPGRGNRVWGARTISSDASWKYINVRRLFIFVEESIEEGTQWVVFEPNDEPLWARVRQTVSNFLFSVWRSGALQGATPGEAFFVKCDRSTMTQDDIDNGRLICLIGIAPVKPAEFVIFRIQQKTLETQLT